MSTELGLNFAGDQGEPRLLLWISLQPAAWMQRRLPLHNRIQMPKNHAVMLMQISPFNLSLHGDSYPEGVLFTPLR